MSKAFRFAFPAAAVDLILGQKYLYKNPFIFNKTCFLFALLQKIPLFFGGGASFLHIIHLLHCNAWGLPVSLEPLLVFFIL